MSTVIKPNPHRDLYIAWSDVCEAPSFVGSRAAMIPYLYELDDRKAERIPADSTPEARISRADKTGTSSWLGSGAWWDTEGLIYEQQGFVPRPNLEVMADRILEDGFDVSFDDLVEPFEDSLE